MMRQLSKLVAPVKRGLKLMVGRGTITRINDATKLQTAQVGLLDGEVRDDVEVFQFYGFSSVPFAGAEAALVAIGGNRDHLVVVGHGDRRYRLTGLQTGEVSIHDDLGHIVKLGRNGIEIHGGGHDLLISGAPNVRVSGGDVWADGISLKHHHHNYSGGATSEAVA